jgi:titin
MPLLNATIPEVPRYLVAAPESLASIRLQWADMSATETSFVIERKNPGETTFQKIGTVGANQTIFIDTGLKGSNPFVYRIAATNGAWRSAYSNEASSILMQDWEMNPASPDPLLATVGADHTIHLTWSDNSTAEIGYTMTRSTDGLKFDSIVDLAANTTAYDDPTVPIGTYEYQVALKISANVNLLSGRLIVTVPDPASLLPVTPAHLSAAMPSASTVNLSWIDMSDNETGFVIERQTEGGTWNQIGTAVAGAMTFSDSPAVGSNYFYRVMAVNASGNSVPSNAVAAGLPAPANLTAQAAGADLIRLAWADNSWNESRFYVERRTLPDGSFSEVGQAPPNSTEFQDKTAVLLVDYEYRVHAGNDNGLSDNSNLARAKIPLSYLLPQPPDGTSALVLSPTSVEIAWQDRSDDELGVIIERSEGYGFDRVGQVASPLTKFVDISAKPGTQYIYRVAAFNLYGLSAYSSFAAVSMPPLLTPSVQGGNVDASKQYDLLVTPNILKNDARHTTVSRLSEHDVDLGLYTTKGEKILSVLTNGQQSLSVELPNLASGLYFFRAEGRIGKIIIVH